MKSGTPAALRMTVICPGPQEVLEHQPLGSLQAPVPCFICISKAPGQSGYPTQEVSSLLLPLVFSDALPTEAKPTFDQEQISKASSYFHFPAPLAALLLLLSHRF